MNGADYTNGSARATPAERARAALQRAVSAFRQFWAQVRTPVLIYIATRLALFIVIYLSLAILPTMAQDEWRGFPSNLFLDGWTRWDAGWYTSIAEHGYSDVPVGTSGQTSVAFFPLYPLFMRIFNVVFHNVFLSGIVVSNLAFLLAAVLFFRMTKERFGEEIAAGTILLWSVYPFSFYFTAVYSDALFCLFVIAAFYGAEREKWWIAGMCAMLAGTTRLLGLALFPALVVFYLERQHFDWRKVRLDILWLILAACGPLLYFLFLYLKFGDVSLFFQAQRAQDWWVGPRALDLFSSTLKEFLSARNLLTAQYPVAFVFNIAIGIVFCVTLIPIFRRQGIGYGALGPATLLLASTQWINVGRYALAIFPAFVAWAQMLKNRVAFECVLVMRELLLALWSIAFSHWAWVT